MHMYFHVYTVEWNINVFHVGGDQHKGMCAKRRRIEEGRDRGRGKNGEPAQCLLELANSRSQPCGLRTTIFDNTVDIAHQ